jgi:hypothetical protein
MIDLLRKRLENEFKPFEVCLTDGRRFIIPHRDFIMVSQKAVVIMDRDELPVTVSPFHIVSVDDLTSTPD